MSDIVFSYTSKALEARLRNTTRRVVGEVSFSVQRGGKLAVIGETGSGKTLTALSIMGLLPDNITAVGLDMALKLSDGRTASGDMGQHVGESIVYIPQNGLEALNPSRTVAKHLSDMVRRVYPKGTDRRKKSLECLSAAGFPEPEEILPMYPFQLSGGMAQRVTIALAMTGKVSLVIADEPTNGLDGRGRENFLSLLDEKFPEAAKILITHDLSLAWTADSVLVLKDGVVMESGPTESVITDPRCLYTKALRDATVEGGMAETPALRIQEGSCPFYSRCSKVTGECLGVQGRRDGERYWRCVW